MKLPVTISLYFGRHFITAVLAMAAGLAGLVALFDFLELLRESATAPRATFGILLEIEALRLPWSFMQIIPFAVLLGGIYAFWRLARSSELVVARAAGISAWQFLATPVFVAWLLGGLCTTALSPVSAVMYGRAEQLDNSYLKPSGGPLSLNGGSLWVRQADKGLTPSGVAVLHASNVWLHNRSLQANHVSILRLSSDTSLLQRLEAQHATLSPGSWDLQDVAVLQPDAPPKHVQDMTFPTDLTVNRVQESFASPNALSFWALPGFIHLLKRSGFSATQHELVFQTLLALPLLCATMALVAAGFSMRPSRRGSAGAMLISGVGFGFALFMVSEVANQFGTSGAIPVVLAAWAPALSGLFLALALLLHLEDG
ncbi:LPS export ABC transporter permease LptG [Acidocella aminolytica]|jgi:lipopolysaccharide export system permease protein|uniref:Transporter YjgP/YjgQ n=1 Tax=Acidocella aminolytica 101 = DSM 11237 TaxID=1120923 RepID=A0A0D6PKN3_9PROT|nr:LPS export ABC transporter permease LptG [Acidocella aminolytica]GAN81304.1 transporter YjgP/YjgQ [Acidocella aminolytica 101 = DSM 11237]GBQ36946.1 transporter YjgP/YjgQ [Acidocella aminolytica 101 = DSM 11237]SHE83120.1 lipopolysaccharide export system permease protein [Acidocella aminolytica 101 = DSM 11237]